jgi:hypothetical protein
MRRKLVVCVNKYNLLYLDHQQKLMKDEYHATFQQPNGADKLSICARWRCRQGMVFPEGLGSV